VAEQVHRAVKVVEDARTTPRVLDGTGRTGTSWFGHAPRIGLGESRRSGIADARGGGGV